MRSARPGGPEVEARVRELHQRGVGAINAGRIGSGGRLLRAGLRRLGWPSATGALTARILISLAPVEIQLGRPEAGLALLDEAERMVAPADSGLLLQQRGLMLVLIGRLADGLAEMDRAIPLLDDSPDVLARTLLNRAMLHQIAGRVRMARDDLDRSETIARARGMDRLLAKVMHNRGYCALLAGDIPGALRDLEAARAGFAAHAEQLLPVIAVDRARVLLAAGLCTEAVAELDAALALFRGQRTQEYGEAELVRAQAALAVGDPSAAHAWARRAERRFHRRGNETWAAVAMLTRLRADFATNRTNTPPTDAKRGGAGSVDLASRQDGDRRGTAALVVQARQGGAGPVDNGGTSPAVGSNSGSIDLANGRDVDRRAAAAFAAQAGQGRTSSAASGDSGSVDLAGRRGIAAFAAPTRQGSASSVEPAGAGPVQPGSARGLDRRRTSALAAQADQVAVRLGELGLANDAEAATLLAARARISLGQHDAAATALAGRSGSHALLDTKLLRALAMAELGTAIGHRAQVFRQARAGLALLREHRGRFGSVDLATGTTALGAELAAIGLSAALAHAVPAQVFRWLELSRAQAFGLRPVRPPADSAIGDAVAELRQLDRIVRDAELAGRPDPAARRRCAELARTIRAHGWQADGAGQSHTAAEFGVVAAELSRRDAALASFLVHDGDLLTVLVADGRATLHRLTEWSPVVEAVGRLHSDLDALCGRALRPSLDMVVRGSARRQLETLTATLIGPVRQRIGDRDLVIVPTDALSGLPWGLLPDLRGRPVTVAPSATAWLHGQASAQATSQERTGPPLLIAGPDLTHAQAEIKAIARLYPRSTVLSGDGATIAATLPELAGRTVAHVAAHGHHEQENVLFSRLDLADGPLMAYDIQQLGAAPAHVVLSSCDVGRMVVRTGDEILGFTAALLYSGTRTVVSSVGRVPDDSVADVMYAYHRALASGASPARALADCTGEATLMPFVCFGAG